MVTLAPIDAGGGVEVTFDPCVELRAKEKETLVVAVENSVGRGVG